MLPDALQEHQPQNLGGGRLSWSKFKQATAGEPSKLKAQVGHPRNKQGPRNPIKWRFPQARPLFCLVLEPKPSSSFIHYPTTNMTSANNSRSRCSSRSSGSSAAQSPSGQKTLVFPCTKCRRRFQVSMTQVCSAARAGTRVEFRCPGCQTVVGWSTEDAIQANITGIPMRIEVVHAVVPPNGPHSLIILSGSLWPDTGVHRWRVR